VSAPAVSAGALHPDDGALVRRLDGAADDGERGALDAHLAACRACAARADALARRSALVAAALAADAAGAPPVPFGWGDVTWRATARAAARRRTLGWRVAAGLALAAGAAAAAPVAARWARRTPAPPQTTAARAVAPIAPSPHAASAEPTSVAFAPGGSTLRVVVAEPQAAGVLELRAADAPGPVVAAVLGDAIGAQLLVLPGELRVRNAPARGASFRLTLPPGVRRVEVRVGDAPAARVDVARGAAPVRLPLTQSLP
jgi:anti-sigma factor RsiW